ncbi:MAG: hypothetical protein ABIH23_20250 [bacterium]
MKFTPTRWSITCLSVLLILGLTTGCKGRKARKAIEDAQAAQSEAQNDMAPRYTPELYNQANRWLSQANDATNAGNHDEAIELAVRAQAQYQQAITTVPQVREKIEGVQNELAGLLDDVAAGIERAVQEGVADDATVTQLQTDLEALQTRQVELRTSIDEEEIRTAITDAGRLKERSDLAKLAHLKPQAEQFNTEIERLVEECQRLNATKYLPDELAAIQSPLESLRTAYAGGNWPAVIESATAVQTGLQEIVTKTQQAAAGEFVAQAEEKLIRAKALEVADVPEYRDFMSQAEVALGKAKESLGTGQHTEAFSAAEQVNALLKQAQDALGASVQRFLDSAVASIQQAEGKEVQRYAPAELAAANTAVQAAKGALEASDFIAAYSQAKSAQETASGLATAALRGHAQLELNAVRNRMSKARSEGAEEYAQPVFGQVAAELAQLNDQFNAGQYDQVIEQAPTKAPRVDEVFQKLRQGVEEAIVRSESSIALAKEAQADTWSADVLQQANQALSSARSLLTQEAYRKAADSAENAVGKAAQAEATAYRLRAEKNNREADETMKLAERADSPTLSPLVYSKAKDIRRRAEERLAAKDYKAGWETSVQALESAGVALNHRIITAQEASDSALEAEARSYDREEIDQALALLNEAKAAQEAQNYNRANETAKQATQLAAKAESFTWRQRSKQLLVKLTSVEQLMAERDTEIHVPVLARRFTVSLASARVNEIDGKWAECYAAAADARDAADESWKEMTQQIQERIDELDGTARTIGDIALDDWGRAQKTDFLPTITEIRRLTDLEMFVEGFETSGRALEQARNLLDEVQRHNLSVRAGALGSTLDHLVKTGSAKILKDQADEIRTLIGTLKSPGDKYDYGQLIAQADSADANLAEFPMLAEENASQRTTQANEILQQAQEAGARKYFRKRLDEAVTHLQWLRNELRGGDCNAIHEHLTILEKSAPSLLEDSSLALAEDEYKQRLTANLNQMKKLMQDFDFIARLNPRILAAARATETTTDDPTLRDAYTSMQKSLTAKRLLAAAELLEQHVIADDPPKTLNDLKQKAVQSFRHFRKAAEGFAAFGNSDLFDIQYRSTAMEGAYDHLKKTLRINKEIAYVIEQKNKDNMLEQFDWKMRQFEGRVERFIWQRPSD